MDNELATLAMTSSDERNHNSTASFKNGKSSVSVRFRVWMANDSFFPSVLYNSYGAKASLGVTFYKFDKVKEYATQSFEKVLVPLPVFVSLFFNKDNYSPVCDITKGTLESVFGYCGNDPAYAQSWDIQTKKRSLSVGDVVEVIKDGESEFFVCASIGWERICRSMSLADFPSTSLKTFIPEKMEY